MTNDNPTGSPPEAALPDPPAPFAWQPVTPRGVAAFAQATLTRLLLVELIVASLSAGVVVWFLAMAWFPTIRQAIQQLPQDGAIRNQQLSSSVTSATLSETRPFLLIVLDLEKQNNASATSDVLLEFHKQNFQICSLLGCVLVNYQKGWNVGFSRPKLAPWWGAWEPILLGLAALFVIVTLMMTWALLAAVYCGVVRVIGFFKDRDLNWRRSWLLASAALLPGALLMPLGILGYGLGVVDLIRLLLLVPVHLVIAWPYLFISPRFVPRLPEVPPRGVNPFATSDNRPGASPP